MFSDFYIPSFGRGSPMQRSRQYDKHRAESAAVKAVEYRVEKIAWKDEKHALVVVSKFCLSLLTYLYQCTGSAMD